MKLLKEVLFKVGCTGAEWTTIGGGVIRKWRISKPKVVLGLVCIFFVGSIGKLVWDLRAPHRAMAEAETYCQHWGFDHVDVGARDWGCVITEGDMRYWVSLNRAPEFELEALNARQRR